MSAIIIYIALISYSCVTADKQDIDAIEGQSVTLSCPINTPQTVLSTKWFYNGNDINLKKIEKYKVWEISTLQSPVYNLQLITTERTDTGKYTCKVEFDDGTIKNCDINLTVGYFKDDPGVTCSLLVYPHTNNQDYINDNTNVTRQLSLLCTAFLGNNIFVNITIQKSTQNQPPIFVHYRNRKQTTAKDGIQITYPLNDTELNGWRFWCVAHHPLSKDVNCSTSTLSKPVVRILQLNETFKCEGEAYPAVISFRWLLCRKPENEQIIGVENKEKRCKTLNSNSSLTLETNTVLGAVLICEVKNDVGVGQANLTISGNKPVKQVSKDRNFFKWYIIGPILVVVVVVVAVFVLIVCKRVSVALTDTVISGGIGDTPDRPTDVTYTAADNTDGMQPMTGVAQLYATPKKKEKMKDVKKYDDSQYERYENTPIYHTLEKND